MPHPSPYLVGLLIASSITFFSCQKEKPPCNLPDRVIPIASEAHSKIPYAGHDTLRFVYRENGKIVDTITYAGQGKVYKNVYVRDGKENDCVYLEYAETYTTLYKTDSLGFDFEFFIEASEGGGHFTVKLQDEEIEDHIQTIDWTQYSGFYQYKEVNGKMYEYVNFFGNQGAVFRIYYTSKQGILRMELGVSSWELID